MKIKKNLYLILTILFGTGLIYDFIYGIENHRLFFMEVNVWVYRLVRLLFVSIFFKEYLDARNAERRKANSNSMQ
jgi:hypothetical protein